jgi:hypothetical protein
LVIVFKSQVVLQGLSFKQTHNKKQFQPYPAWISLRQPVC